MSAWLEASEACGLSFQERYKRALEALQLQLAALPDRLHPATEGLRSYVIAIGEAMACRDELQVLQLLSRQEGVIPTQIMAGPDDEYAQAKTLLNAKTREFWNVLAQLRTRPGADGLLWADYHERFAPRTRAGVKDTAQVLRLKKEEEALKAGYFKLCHAVPGLPVHRTSGTPELAVIPREERKKSWLKHAGAWAQKADEIEVVFSALLSVRHKLAVALSFNNYAEYMYSQRRTDTAWLPEQFLARLSGAALPLVCYLQSQKKEHLGLARLRPYDAHCEELRASEAGSSWPLKMQSLFARIDPAFERCFRIMADESLIARKSGSQGMCRHLQHSRRPYLMLGDEFSPKGLMAAIHEIAHGIHILLAAEQELPFHRRIPPLPGELAALSLELFAGTHLDVFFENEEIALWARRKHLEGVLALFPTAFSVEQFEAEIYSHETSVAERRHLFAHIMQEHLGLVDYEGYEDVLQRWYQRIPTLVLSPGYFFNYAIAQAGAVTVLEQFKEHGQVPDNFMYFLSQGSRLTNEHLYTVAGATPDNMYASGCVHALAQELAGLECVY